METVQERIKAVRVSKGLSQKDFAEAIGISRGYVSRLETEQLQIQDRIFKLISSELGVSELWLRTGEGQMNNQAIEDMIEFADSARGKVVDPNGQNKADALLMASYVYHQFQSISFSCDSFEEFLALFDSPEYSKNIAYITSVYASAIKDKKSDMIRAMFNNIFEREFNVTETIDKLRIDRADRIEAFKKSSLSQYLETLYYEIIQDNIDADAQGHLAVAGVAAAGVPLHDDSQEEMVPVPPKYLDDSRFFIVKAKGDSMSPKINSGDFVVVQKNTPPDNGAIALVRVESQAMDEYTIKLFFPSKRNIELRSINEEFEPMRFHPRDVHSAEKVVYIIPGNG